MTITFLLADILWRSAVYGSIAFVVVGLARVLYLLFIYPNYVSPLRDLPGPKVSLTLDSTFCQVSPLTV